MNTLCEHECLYVTARVQGTKHLRTENNFSCWYRSISHTASDEELL